MIPRSLQWAFSCAVGHAGGFALRARPAIALGRLVFTAHLFRIAVLVSGLHAISATAVTLSPALLFGTVPNVGAAAGAVCAAHAQAQNKIDAGARNIHPHMDSFGVVDPTKYDFDCYDTFPQCNPAALIPPQQCTNLSVSAQVQGTPTCSYWWGSGFAFGVDGFCHRNVPDPDLNNCPTCKNRLNPGIPPTSVGNPINPANGNKSQVETDYVGTGPFPLTFTRTYNSNPQAATDNVDLMAKGFGRRWRHTYFREITGYCVTNGTTVFGDCTVTIPTIVPVYVRRPGGETLTFTGQRSRFLASDQGAAYFVGNPISGDPILVGSVVFSVAPDQTLLGMRYNAPDDDEVELYDSDGRLVSITNRAGLTQTLGYSAGLLTQVTDPFGRSLSFTHTPQGFIATMTDPAGGVYSYAYNSDGMLSSVTYPDGKVRTYVYNEPAYTSGSNQPAALTGIVDENSDRFANFGYDGSGKSVLTEHAGGVNRYTVSIGGGVNLVIDPLGTTRIYNYGDHFGLLKTAGVGNPPCPSCGPAGAAYDARGFPSSMSNYNNITTTFAYDARGLENSRTEGSGLRTIATAWHPAFSLPQTITEPLRTTNFIYDPSGNLTQKTITAAGQTRTWNFTYDSRGLMLMADGPRTDALDISANTYDAQGNLTSVTNALGQSTAIGPYDANGRPLRMTDTNGLVTQLTYDARGRLVTRNAGGETTTYTYDGVGQLTRVTLPDGSSLQYTYDAAHRLTAITDSLGNRIAYTLDAMGNRTREDIYDAASTLVGTKRRVYDTNNRLTQEIGAAGQITAYTYDNEGNVTQVTDPLSHRTLNSYDALNRLFQVRDELSGFVRYTYDTLDQLTQVTDQRNLATNYTVNGLGNVTQVQSPDTGVTASTFDAAGNVLTRTDAKGQVTTYAYDGLNRVTAISYASDASLNVAFTYDQGANGIGRLTGLTDNSGSTSHAYEVHGRLTSETRTIGGVTYVTSYAYDNAGRLSAVTYPSGRLVSYSRDGLGRVSGISTTQFGVTQVLLTGVSYRPFGPEQVLSFGNNSTYTRSYDQDGRIAGFTLPGQTRNVIYDAASRITSIADPVTPANSFSAGYDVLDRLTSYAGPGVSQTFQYDAVGNRTRQSIGVGAWFTTYAATSNRIVNTGGPTAKTFTFDADGSIVNDTLRSFGYDARGRMSQATTSAGSIQYVVNAMGQRVQKTVAGVATVFHYDSGGRLIAETDAAGAVKVEYVYLNDIPLAVLK